MKMSKSSCSFTTCDYNLITDNGQEVQNLSPTDKQHVRRFHRQATRREGINGAMFTFRRDPQRNMAYVCPCGSQQACIDGLKIHVRGSVNRSMKRKGCPTIAELAKKIKKSKKCLYEDKNEDLPFNGEPSDSINEEGEEDLEKERKISTITAISNHTQQRRNHNNHNHRNNNHHNLIDMTTTINDILPLEDSDSYDFDIDSQYILDDCENNQALQDALDRLNKAQVELRRAQTELQRAQVVLQKAQVDIRNLCKGRISK